MQEMHQLQETGAVTKASAGKADLSASGAAGASAYKCEFTGKKVLMIVENLPVPFDRRVWHEATALRDAGATVSVICPCGKGYEKRYELLECIAIYRYGSVREADGALGYLLEYGVSFFWQFILSLKCLHGRGFDVIHACNPPDMIYLVAKPFKLLGKKFVFDHHDLSPELFIAKFKKMNFLYRALLYFERRTFKNADITIATNDSYKRVAIERGGKAPADVFVVRSGPSLERMRMLPPIESLKKGRRYLVGYLGVIGKQEGLHFLVDAAAYLIREKGRNDIHFICVGGGTELGKIVKYAEDNGVGDYFTFTGRVPDQQMLEALNTADVCVNPDEFNELNDKSTMNKIMEYMALAKPIVQFDLTEGRHSAREASLYAMPDNHEDLALKIMELLDDPVKRDEMGRYGYERIKNTLEWGYERENLYRAYRRIFGKE